MSNHLGTRWRGKLPVPEHAHPLVRQFIAKCNDHQATLTDISRRTKLRRCTISGWRYRSTPRLIDFEAAVNALGFELCIRERR